MPTRFIRVMAFWLNRRHSPRSARTAISSSSARDPNVIAMMGDKVEARRTMTAAGVPILPGSPEPIESAEEAKRAATRDRFSGDHQSRGGRRRTRNAYRPQARGTRRHSSRLAQTEALAAFKNGSVYIERYIERPRHIEIQILADEHGKLHPSRRARMHDPAPPSKTA